MFNDTVKPQILPGFDGDPGNHRIRESVVRCVQGVVAGLDIFKDKVACAVGVDCPVGVFIGAVQYNLVSGIAAPEASWAMPLTLPKVDCPKAQARLKHARAPRNRARAHMPAHCGLRSTLAVDEIAGPNNH